MNSDIVGRIKEFMGVYNFNSLSLSKALNYNGSEKISRLFRGSGAKPSYDIIYDISNKFDINVDWLVTGRGIMKKEDNISALVSYEPAIGVPYYDVDFIGGFNLLENDQTIIPAHNIIFKQYEDATLWCNITGNSMAQKINHGDIIALQEMHSIEDVLYGEIYAVVLDTLRTVKILRKSSNPNKLRFIPVNTAEYDEQEFDKSRIIKLYAVLGSISKFF